jgi:hypothetical protein
VAVRTKGVLIMNTADDPEVERPVRCIPITAIKVDASVQQRVAGTTRSVVEGLCQRDVQPSFVSAH